VSCQDYELCGQGSCNLDQAYNWNLIAVSATILNDGFDSGGPSSCSSYIVDAFVTVVLDGAAASTTPAQETTSPMWNEKVASGTTYAYLNNMLTISLSDDDGMGMCSTDDPIDACAHQVDAAELIAGGFVIDFCGVNVQNLTFELVPA
jgi:hypothetical protein